ncbi:MAG: IPT/TIG domain-containing protein [Patescibacteria group bacterium]|mgnify:CR=1 FL=1
MFKINNKLIVFALTILAISTFNLNQVNAAGGYYGGTAVDNSYKPQVFNTTPTNNPAPVIKSIDPSSSGKGLGTKTITIKGGGFIPSSVARMNGFDRTTIFIDSSTLMMKLLENDLYRDTPFYVTVFNRGPGGGHSNAANFTIYQNSAPRGSVQSKSNTVSTSGTVVMSETPDTFYEIPSAQGRGSQVGSLASNAIFGENGFLPSGLIQWILFAIVILLIVILVRKVFGAQENYHATPLKHS